MTHLFNVSISLNGRWINVTTRVLTLLEFCSWNGIEIPRFCYHEKLSIAGNCRMCLVELYKSFKPIVSCATPIANKMEVYTDTALIKNSREHILEFLLINHPLDCPICDQGGECDLQDQAIIYGSDRGRFKEKKRSVDDKWMGPLIKTIMTRCIHCTRCVRFSSEIGGEFYLGTLGRGRDTEISSYVERAAMSIFSGNMIDLCPVGALTSKPYAFTARSWELRSVQSIDILDTLGSSIRIDARGSEIMRILPVYNKQTDEEWITDKVRFCYDGLKLQRLTVPMVKHRVTQSYVNVSWEYGFSIFISALVNVFFKDVKRQSIFVYNGDLIDFETGFLMKEFCNFLGFSFLNYDTSMDYGNNDFRYSYLINSSIKDFASYRSYLFVATQLLYEAPLLYIKVKKGTGGAFKRRINYVGSSLLWGKDTHVKHLSMSPNTYLRILEARHFVSCDLKQTNHTLIASNSQFSLVSLLLSRLVCSGFNAAFSYIPSNVSSLIQRELNVSSHAILFKQLAKIPRSIFQYVIGNLRKRVPPSSYRVYQGHHADLNAFNADLLFPSVPFSEKTSYYMNSEGRFLRTTQAVNSAGISKEDFEILLALSHLLKVGFCYGSKEEFLFRLPFQLNSSYVFNNIKLVEFPINTGITFSSFKNSLFSPSILNFYSSDVISMHSKILSSCSFTFIHNF